MLRRPLTPHDGKLQRLAAQPLFADLSFRRLERLGAAGDFLSLPAHTRLVSQGAHPRDTYVLLAGEAEDFVRGTGTRTPHGSITVGMAAAVHHLRHPATVFAATPVLCYVIMVNRLYAALTAAPALAEAVAQEFLLRGSAHRPTTPVRGRH